MKALELAPPVLLGVAIAAAWVMVLVGGVPGVIAWTLVLPLALPILCLPLAAAALIRIGQKRSLSASRVASLGVGLLGFWPGVWIFGICLVPYPADVREVKPAATVRLPADGPLIVIWGGDDIDHNQHARAVDQRWAYDLAPLPAAHGSKQLSDYGCYGLDVKAPISGTVVVAHDGEPELAPAEPPSNPTRPLGNHVVLEIEGGTFIVLAHLQPNSLTVRVAERVDEGTVLGRCGNSGNTSEPHVHIHHQRQDPRRFPFGFAEGLPLFFRLDGEPRMPRGGIDVDPKGGAILTGDLVEHKE